MGSSIRGLVPSLGVCVCLIAALIAAASLVARGLDGHEDRGDAEEVPAGRSLLAQPTPVPDLAVTPVATAARRPARPERTARRPARREAVAAPAVSRARPAATVVARSKQVRRAGGSGSGRSFPRPPAETPAPAPAAPPATPVPAPVDQIVQDTVDTVDQVVDGLIPPR